MKKLLPALVIVAGLPALPATAQDMAAAQKWANAKVVKYRVEGVHKARIPVVHGDYDGKADVTDRLVVEFTWDVKKAKVVGPVSVVDGKSEVQNLKSDGTNCPPPQLKGEYEHFQTQSNHMVGDLIQITGTRTFPAASVSNYPASCSMRAVQGTKQEAQLYLTGAGPEALAMPALPPGGPITIAADRKSFTLKGAENWSWTFTPTLMQ
jgi:hypothetical protein